MTPCHPTHGTTGKDKRKVRRIHKWKGFQAPWEEETPGFEEVKLEVVTPPTPPEPEGGGPDSGITCFKCHNDTYRIVGHRSEEEILAELPTEQFRRSKGKGDPEAAQAVLMLACPKCKGRVQMKESVVRSLK